jgi:hypothetical protein
MAGSDAQRFAALQHANEVRVARAELKRRIARKEVDVLDVLRRPPAEVRDMPLADILPSVPKVGKKKADRILARTHTTSLPVTRIGDTTKGAIARLLP